MWGDKDCTKDDWQAASSPLDVGEPVTAVDIAPVVTENSRQDVIIIQLLSCLHLCSPTSFNEEIQVFILVSMNNYELIKYELSIA